MKYIITLGIWATMGYVAYRMNLAEKEKAREVGLFDE